jgi:putative PIN family toxin of toxin-antitoxin system
MRVFLDTNVIVSAMATRGICADVLREVFVRHQLVVSEKLLDEVKFVLLRKIGVPPDIIKDVLALLRDGSAIAVPVPLTNLPLSNSADRALISAAVNGKADLFVTGDGELLALSETGPINIVSPRMFWEKAKEKR